MLQSVVTGNETGDAEVAGCIAEVSKTWTFPEPEAGGNVVVTHPFMLESTE